MKPSAAAVLCLAVAASLGACAPGAPGGPGVQTPQARAAPDCRAVLPEGAEHTLPRSGRHDPELADLAVLDAVNRIRCGRGLVPLAPDRSVRQAAEIHARDMARLGFFDHRSPVAGHRSMTDRLGLAGARFRIAAENIIEARYMAYRNGAPYRVEDATACLFRYTDGTPLKRQSYASLADEIVARWMESPGHRRNLMDPALRRHGFALAPTRDPALCGGLYGAQVFTD